MVVIQNKKAAVTHARELSEQIKQSSGLLNLFGVNSDRIIAGLDASIEEIRTRGELDTYLMVLRFSGPERVFIDSVLHTGQTGERYFDSIYQASDWILSEQVRFQKEQARLDKEVRTKHAAKRAEQERIRIKEEQRALAARLGIDAARLAELQGGNDNEASV